MSHGKKVEDIITDNSLSQKANVAEYDYMQPYSSSDKYFDAATDLSNFMGNRGTDIDMIHNVLNCSKALQQRKTLPQERTHRQQREPLQKELQIKDHEWSRLVIQ